MSSILETCITLPWLYNYTQDNAMPWNWGMKEKLLLINTTVGVTIRGCGGAECLINNWAGSLSLYWLSVCTGQAYTGYHSICCSHQTLHTTQCTLHTIHYTMHNAYCTLHATHYTMHTAHYTLHNAQCTLHITQCTMHNAHYTLLPSPVTGSTALLARVS